MGRLSEQTEYTEMNNIEQMIRESSFSKHDLSSQIMNRIGENEMSRTTFSFQRSVFKKTAVAASVVVLLGAGTIGAGFVSPAMADALKVIPGLGVIYEGTSAKGIETAMEKGMISEPEQAVTHDGITLKLANLLYDGTRLSFVLEREGAELENVASPYFMEGANIPKDKQEKGYVERPTLLANGKEIKFSSGGFGDSAHQKNAFFVELTHGLNLPDQFELTIQTKVTKVEEPFEFKVPVQIENNALVLKPGISKSDSQFSYTVKELYISPVSTRLIVDSKGLPPESPQQSGDYSASKVYYEIVDDQGNALNQHQFGYFSKKPETAYHIDELYSPFTVKPTKITIKPFTLTVKNDDFSIVGQKKDSNGNILPGEENQGDRTYLTNLELTIPVEP